MLVVINVSCFVEDVEIYGSDEFGLLWIGDELCCASALMLYKCNLYAFVVIRGGVHMLFGCVIGVFVF